METIMLDNTELSYERKRIGVEDLTLDPMNPRIQYLIGRVSGDVTQEQLDEMLWEKNSVKALGMAIEQNGGVYEDLIVQRSDGRYLVREGNSRTVATRHIAKKHEDDERYKTVPVMIFGPELTEDLLAVILAGMHVAGKIRWDAYEQAKHVYDMSVRDGKSYEWLSTHLRISKSKITQDLRAYKWTKDYLEEVDSDPRNLEKFAFFQELARKKDLTALYNEDDAFRSDFISWLKEGRLSASNQVRKLDKVLANPEARAALAEKGFNEASTVLVSQDPSLGSNLYEAIRRATEQIKKAPMDEVQALSEDRQKLIMLRNLRRAIDDLATFADVTL